MVRRARKVILQVAFVSLPEGQDYAWRAGLLLLVNQLKAGTCDAPDVAGSAMIIVSAKEEAAK
jgi:hypothetical protein